MTLWGGRFSDQTEPLLKTFGDSIHFDQRLAEADIRGSLAYAGALHEAGLITDQECQTLSDGLGRVRVEFQNGEFTVKSTDEDIHTAVERRLGELVGSVAGKLHTGRSRNDQVATDVRVFLLDAVEQIAKRLTTVQRAIVQKAAAHEDAIMPGYTHLQRAQPVLFAHWLMAFFWKLERDHARLENIRQETASLPLGCGALAGNPFAIDRRALARDLGFDTVAANSIDAVADRDFVVGFLSWAALTQVHLSTLAEDLVIWSTPEFGFVELDDRYATGSSLMPQKKNPDSLELLRGKSGRLIGHLTGMLAMLKGLPTAYNKDLQEDKEPLFDAVDTMSLSLAVAAGVIRTLIPKPAAMRKALDVAMMATDMADYLVKKGIPFRESHHLVGEAVHLAETREATLADLELVDYQAIHPAFDRDLYDVFDAGQSVAARVSEGGTAPQAVRAQIEQARSRLNHRHSQ